MADARSLDDLDRLSFRLARVIRQQYPQLATQGFTLSDLEERLLPYRETRREMADGGAESWERAVLRLLAGERDLVLAESGLRDASRQALSSPSPSLSLVRAWSSSLLTLQGTPVLPGHESRAESAAYAGVHCRYCSGRLPGGCRVTFCPHCGLDQTKRQCPACSTELEADWRFCVTCGRGADAQRDEARVPALRAAS
jgi:hypothetical protein